MVLPEDKGQAKEQSEIRMTYDDKFIYSNNTPKLCFGSRVSTIKY